MKLKEVLKNYQLKGFEIEFYDLYGNGYKKRDLNVEIILKIEELEVRNVNINFKLNKATFYLIGLYDLLKENDK